MSVFAPPTVGFVAELDGAIQAHLDWTRRVLRCAVLRVSPGDDVLAADAHLRCSFGRWFVRCRAALDQVDAAAAQRVQDQHARMHAGVRRLCTDLLAGRPGDAAALDAFETSQSALIADLARLKTGFLARSARHDPLTGLPLRYGFEEEFVRFRALTERIGQTMVMAMADVDHFKRVNDRHGHGVGDQALRHVATVLRAQARAEEPVFRFGGEEFLLLLHAADPASAASAADRLLKALRDAPLTLADGQSLRLTLSTGLITVGRDESVSEAVARADAALYAAKHAGRDCWRWGRTGSGIAA